MMHAAELRENAATVALLHVRNVEGVTNAHKSASAAGI